MLPKTNSQQSVRPFSEPPPSGGHPTVPLESTPKRSLRLILFFSGLLFASLLLLLCYLGWIKISGPFMPFMMILFHQRLEFVLRFQALALIPILINALILFSLESMDNQFNTKRWTQPLMTSSLEYLLSLVVQLALCANLKPEQVMLFCPLMTVLFFCGRLQYLIFYPNYHHFGSALSLFPSICGILFNAFATLAIIFY